MLMCWCPLEVCGGLVCFSLMADFSGTAATEAGSCDSSALPVNKGSVVLTRSTVPEAQDVFSLFFMRKSGMTAGE